MLLKSAPILRYSEPMISSGVQACQEVKILKEKISSLQEEQRNWEQMKKDLSSKIEELQEQVKSKNQILGECKGRVMELEKI